jgi:16S rRNA (cytosine967-C5)-methyltransferase
VLSRLQREGARLPDEPTLPAPYGERWAAAYGADKARLIARTLASEAPTDLSLRDPAATGTMTDALEGRTLAPAHVRTARRGTIGDWPGFGEGSWWVQDLAASLPARLLGDVAGAQVVDLCAAPGGKTLQLAAAGAAVTAVVLLDAPCSASGIFRRHPDVLHLKGGRDLGSLVELQSELLERAAGWLSAGGRLVYCVCSLEPEEGEMQVEAFLERHPEFRIDPVSAEELPAGLLPSPQGWVRTPSMPRAPIISMST